MKLHKQLHRHEAAKGVYGDCHRTALACILDLDSPADAPHFIGTHENLKAQGEDFNWQAAQEQWLNGLGYTTADFLYGCESVEDLFTFMDSRNAHVYYLLGGTSPRGTNHTVVCLGGAFAWDPHPDGGNLVGPMDHGFYEVTVVLPLSMKK